MMKVLASAHSSQTPGRQVLLCCCQANQDQRQADAFLMLTGKAGFSVSYQQHRYWQAMEGGSAKQVPLRSWPQPAAESPGLDVHQPGTTTQDCAAADLPE